MYYNEFYKIGINCPNRTSGNAKVVCPKCSERKSGTRDKDLSINYSTGAYKCHSNKCGWQGYVKSDEYQRPEFSNRTDLPDRKAKWLKSRGISQSTIKKLRLTTDKHGNIEFNYFRSGQLINIKTRFEINGKKSYRQFVGAEKIVYNLDSLIGKDKCIFVEGEMDVATWVECGVDKEYGVVSVDQGAPNPNSNPGAKLDCLKNCALELDQMKAIYICTDKDAPGVFLQQELIRRFGAHRCYVVDLPKGVKDANEIVDRRQGNDYPHDTNISSLRLFLKNAKPVPVPGIHTLDSEQSEILDGFFENGRPKGKTTHYPELDKNFSFLRGDLTVFTGIPGHGKSQFLRQLMINKSHFDGWKWASYVPEDFPFDYFAEDIIKCYQGKNVDKAYNNRMSKQEFEEGKQFVRDHFFCIYPEADENGVIPLPTNEWINEKIRFAKLKHGINSYVKDPWNQIAHDFTGREDQYLSQEFAKEKFFASQFDASLYTAHPKGMQKNKDGSYPCPDAYDLSGGSMWYNKFDNIISVFRPNAWELPKDKIVEIHSKKIKKQRVVGSPGECEFYFDVAGARYIQSNGDFHPMKSKTATISPAKVDDDFDFPDWDELTGQN